MSSTLGESGDFLIEGSSHQELSTVASRQEAQSLLTLRVLHPHPQPREGSFQFTWNLTPKTFSLSSGGDNQTVLGKLSMTFSDFSRDTHFHNFPVFSRHFYSVSRTFERERENGAGPNWRQTLTSSGMTHGSHLEQYAKEEEGSKNKKQTPLLKYRAVILIPPDQDLGDGSDGLHQ